jgi:hypothetical protein
VTQPLPTRRERKLSHQRNAKYAACRAFTVAVSASMAETRLAGQAPVRTDDSRANASSENAWLYEALAGKIRCVDFARDFARTIGLHWSMLALSPLQESRKT